MWSRLEADNCDAQETHCGVRAAARRFPGSGRVAWGQGANLGRIPQIVAGARLTQPQLIQSRAICIPPSPSPPPVSHDTELSPITRSRRDHDDKALLILIPASTVPYNSPHLFHPDKLHLLIN